LRNRIEKLQSLMDKEQIDLLILVDPINQFYFSGSAQHQVMAIPLEKDPVLWVVRSFERAKSDSWITDIREASSFSYIFELMAREFRVTGRFKIAMEYNITSLKMFENIKTVFPDAEFCDCMDILLTVRKVKDRNEIGCLMESAKICDRAFLKAKEFLCENIGKVTEIDLETEIDCRIRKLGSEGHVYFYGLGGKPSFYRQNVLCISGSEAAVIADYPIIGGVGLGNAIPHGATFKEINPGDSVVIDASAVKHGYHSDTARTFFYQSPIPEIKHAYNVAYEFMQVFKENAKPYVRICDVLNKAADVVKKNGLADYFMGCPPLSNLNIGHGVGLFINEYPFIYPKNTEIFLPGMVFAVEPKFCIPEKGFVQIENTFYMTEEGIRSLSGLPENLSYWII